MIEEMRFFYYALRGGGGGGGGWLSSCFCVYNAKFVNLAQLTGCLCAPLIAFPARKHLYVCARVFPGKGLLADLGRKGADFRRWVCPLGCLPMTPTSRGSLGWDKEPSLGVRRLGLRSTLSPLNYSQ